METNWEEIAWDEAWKHDPKWVARAREVARSRVATRRLGSAVLAPFHAILDRLNKH